MTELIMSDLRKKYHKRELEEQKAKHLKELNETEAKHLKDLNETEAEWLKVFDAIKKEADKRYKNSISILVAAILVSVFGALLSLILKFITC